MRLFSSDSSMVLQGSAAAAAGSFPVFLQSVSLSTLAKQMSSSVLIGDSRVPIVQVRPCAQLHTWFWWYILFFSQTHKVDVFPQNWALKKCNWHLTMLFCAVVLLLTNWTWITYTSNMGDVSFIESCLSFTNRIPLSIHLFLEDIQADNAYVQEHMDKINSIKTLILWVFGHKRSGSSNMQNSRFCATAMTWKASS